MVFRIRDSGDLFVFIIFIIIVIIYDTFGYAGCMGVLVALGLLLYYIQEEEIESSEAESMPEKEIKNQISKTVGGPCSIDGCKSNHMYKSEFCYKHRGSKSTIVAIHEEVEEELGESDWWEVTEEEINE
tara:strand:+ start:115 stop:501 length:387 start_codon:yes stop_codon:yes gene_type:complete